MKIIPAETKHMHPLAMHAKEKKVQFIPLTQRQLLDTDLKLQEVPLIWGTSKFKMLVPIDKPVPVKQIPATTEVTTPPDEAMMKGGEENYQYKIKIPTKIRENL
jgi:hypothetical protein